MIRQGLTRNLFNGITLSIRQFNKMQSDNLNAAWSLEGVISKLESFAPLCFAEKWDNAGLLIEPYQKRNIKKIFLTNDLTLNVMEEAVEKDVDMIISYHPPIFAPLKRIVQDNWKSKIVSICLAKGIAVYSPHTAWDCAPNGESVNSWLSKAFKPSYNAKPISMNEETLTGPGLIWSYPMNMSYKLGEVIEDIQRYIQLPVQVALGLGHSLDSQVSRFACCAGSGASLLKEVSNIDVYVTGEMSHHDLLDAQHRQITVILCNHSNTERGFLKEFQPKLYNMLQGACEIIVSENDRDPLVTFTY